MSAEAVYTRFLVEWSDVRDHLPRLHDAARGMVLELGTRFGVSTAALLAGVHDHGGHLYSLDIDRSCGSLFTGDPAWTFVCGSSHTDHPEIPSALDVLFVDTTHTEADTYDELRRWGSRVRPGGVIYLHDTDDGSTYPGVRNAMERWCSETGRAPIYHEGSYGLGEIKC